MLLEEARLFCDARMLTIQQLRSKVKLLVQGLVQQYTHAPVTGDLSFHTTSYPLVMLCSKLAFGEATDELTSRDAKFKISTLVLQKSVITYQNSFAWTASSLQLSFAFSALCCNHEIRKSLRIHLVLREHCF